MSRVILASGVLLLVVVVVVVAQPPAPGTLPAVLEGTPAAPPVAPPTAPPLIPPVPPAEARLPQPPRPLPPVGGTPAAAGPTAPAETPLSKFEPLDAFPQAAQQGLRAALLGSAWMAKVHQPDGRFQYGYIPSLRAPMSGDNNIYQARAAVAMAQAARFSGDREQAALASQTVLSLLAGTDPNTRVPVSVSFVCNRVGFAALLALAIYELPNPPDKLLDDAERLCAFLRAQLRTDGSVHYTDGPTDVPTQVDPAGVNEYPGCALHALAVSNRVRPAEWKKEAVKRGVAHYAAAFKAKPHPLLAATVTPAAAELYAQLKLPDAAAAAFEMNDWLCGLQIAPTDPRTPQWGGGFRVVAGGRLTSDPPGAAETALLVHSLACAYQTTRLGGDREREGKYRETLTAAVLFLCGLQYLEPNTRHFENAFRTSTLIGAVHRSPVDGTLRIDATACTVTGLLRYLSCGAERQGP